MLREAVQAQRKAIVRAHGGDFKVDAVGGNANELNVPVHGHSEMLIQSNPKLSKMTICGIT